MKKAGDGLLFSSITFLYYFLPLVLVLYFALPKAFRNWVLLFASLFFYAWPDWRGFWRNDYLVLLLGATFSAWAFGFFIERHRGTRFGRMALFCSVFVNLLLLAVFKYADFVLENVNRAVSLVSDSGGISLLGLALPIGISFYTFQILSYTLDLYRGEVKLQRNYFKFTMYVALFPQLIAGPIVRYSTVERELDQRSVSMMDFGDGTARFVVGLGKKVLLANVLGELCQHYRQASESTVLFTWLYVLAFAFQIYYDFSGYSDMAIGLGRIFGFRFGENFRYPYVARSVTEFWRRWHISLGSWFRDYVYIPLGGNRAGPVRYGLNILIVWFLTGFWHGAGWNFIIWGLYFGVLLLLEKYVLGKLLQKLPPAIPWLYTFFVVLLSWMFFDGESIAHALSRIGQLFGTGGISLSDTLSRYYLKSFTVPLLIAAVGATPLPRQLWERLEQTPMGARMLMVAKPLLMVAVMLVATGYLVDGSFNPFIYFRF